MKCNPRALVASPVRNPHSTRRVRGRRGQARCSLVRGSLRGRVALALVGLNVQQHRLPSAAVADVFKDGDQVVQVVAVDGPDVVKAELLEEGAAGHQPAGVLVDLGVGLGGGREGGRHKGLCV
eukprot:scaffold23468_cov45-Isochrysis_galbana.AAC.1